MAGGSPSEQERDLVATLAEAEEERQQRHADIEPRAEIGHIHRQGAGHHA